MTRPDQIASRGLRGWLVGVDNQGFACAIKAKQRKMPIEEKNQSRLRAAHSVASNGRAMSLASKEPMKASTFAIKTSFSQRVIFLNTRVQRGTMKIRAQ
jgi:hypothetical protein